MTTRELDVLVVGGGPAGLAFALLMHGNRPLRIGVVEAGPEPTPAGKDIGQRVVALSPASRAILDACGAWTPLPPQRIGPFRRMVVWRDGSSI